MAISAGVSRSWTLSDSPGGGKYMSGSDASSANEQAKSVIRSKPKQKTNLMGAFSN
ncbi:MAG TPA: hypothetical protein VMY37_35635 [Thermoguttaceae bacterium]|nr:hypothetical protein [Thermoguttaceae bacterium]